ncbi:MAG TPA: helix-turn-helix transcriptional regulator [Longimicrobiales bacterium]
MIAPTQDLRPLLKAVIGLVNAADDTPSEMIRIRGVRYRLTAEHHESTGWIVVLMQEPAERFVCDEVLRECYGLTNREIEVARLLINRVSNREIADALDVTVSTAGRHTERVLKKLGIGTRRDVRDKLKL